jgi:zinc transport system permease protein
VTILGSWIDELAHWISTQVPDGTILSLQLMVLALFALTLIGVMCGGLGSLVVGSRMAFFSDALAHCAFAGVALGLMLGFLTGATEETLHRWITVIMVVFGIIMGLLIAVVRDRTGQASDTVIGVFFAAAIGLGAIFLKAGASRRYLPAEDFLFGSLVQLDGLAVGELLLLTLVITGALAWIYNRLVFASFNPSLARSRGVAVRACSYLFIILLAIIVNVCLKTVGVLLINALLIVPAATAANLARNMRQLFALSIVLCILCGLGGLWVSWEISQNTTFRPGESGTIVVLAVLLYFGSIFLSPLVRHRRHGGVGPVSAGRELMGGGEPAP